MRIGSIVFAALAFVWMSSGAHAVSVVFGNQEGGLIPSQDDMRNREFQLAVFQAANAHCAFYNRVAYLSGVSPGYGNYISFICRFPPGYDPVKAGAFHWPF